MFLNDPPTKHIVQNRNRKLRQKKKKFAFSKIQNLFYCCNSKGIIFTEFAP